MKSNWMGFQNLLLPAAAGFIALLSVGFVSPTTPTSLTGEDGFIGIRVLRPDLTVGRHEASPRLSATAGAAIKCDALTGAPRLISGDLLGGAALESRHATLDDYIAQAQRYLAAHADTIGVAAADLELDRDAILVAKDVQFLKFRVRHGGLLVRDATVDFRFQQGKLVQVANQSFAEAAGDDRPALSGLDHVAERAVLGGNAELTGEAYRVVTDGSGYRMVRVSEFKTRSQDDRLFIVAVEQATGKIFEIRPTEFYLDGSVSGSVYPRYYGETAQNLPYRDATLPYGGGSVTADANGKFVDAPTDAQPKLDGFQGTRVKITPKTGAKVVVDGASRGNSWDIVFQKGPDAPSEDKNMAQSMTYYHLNKEFNHVKKFISTPWLDQQLTANVNLAQSCNAYWDGSSVNLFSAGSGCANTALIADVFYHEWGHGLDANTGGIEDGAFSEGYADTMSLMMLHSNIIGKGFKVADGSPVRDLTTFLHYPEDAHQEIHREGLIIGGSFWDLFNSLKDTYGEDQAGDMLSNYALKVIFTASKYTDVYDALLVIDGAGNSSVDHTPNFCAINKAFSHHGLATADASCH